MGSYQRHRPEANPALVQHRLGGGGSGRDRVTALNWSGLHLRGLPRLASLAHHTQHITSLDLSRNALLKLAGLEHLPALEHLNVSDNRLVRVQDLSHNTRLLSLDASNNSLTCVSGLHGCHHLRHLRLRNNSVRRLENLRSQWRLETLDASRNALEAPDDLDLSPCVCLCFLNLSHNAVTSLAGASVGPYNLNLIQSCTLKSKP